MKINDEVKRIGSGDYTEGRQGTVIEIDDAKGRVRVSWHTGADGAPYPKPIRTWVQVAGVEVIAQTQESGSVTSRDRSIR
jgi:hypothetical protein